MLASLLGPTLERQEHLASEFRLESAFFPNFEPNMLSILHTNTTTLTLIFVVSFILLFASTWLTYRTTDRLYDACTSGRYVL